VGVNKSDAWPPPDWYEILIMWETMLKCNNKHPNDITEWCYRYPGYGCWHLHGFNSTEGFAFRFEDPRDATAFGLRWG
jgi:hypothetical protein